MDEKPLDDSEDESLKALLESWKVGSPSDALEARLRQTLRSETPRSPRFGRGWLSASVRVPVPLFVGLVLACLVSVAFAIWSRSPRAPATAERPSPLPQPPPAAVEQRASLVGFEPVREPKLVVLRRGEQP